MLVLSRKETQRIRLGDSIVVTIVKISGDKVRVGIEAPADVLVLRDELEVRSVPAQSAAVNAGLAPLASPAALPSLQRSA
jgi:carbon storage regulator